ncbi:MAG: DUF3786 domain-containing protein [Lachnospiraceae bacterium]|nr:DUF3786 domain-containing protein [Lachnospiraceae bacterium]
MNNYEIAVERARPLFLQHDQEAMIRKFHLEADAAYLYISFVGRRYRINRGDGVIEWSEDNFSTAFPASFNEAMTIYDILCYSKDHCRLSGRFVTLGALKYNTAFGSGDSFFRGSAKAFDGRIPELECACRALGGKKEAVGDTAWLLPLFDFLPVVLQFWNSDDEFPASLKLLWDENILDYMHFETTFYAASHLLERIRSGMDTPHYSR